MEEIESRIRNKIFQFSTNTNTPGFENLPLVFKAIFNQETNNMNEESIFVEFLITLCFGESENTIEVDDFNTLRTCILSNKKLAKIVHRFGFACRSIKFDKRFDAIRKDLCHNTDNYRMWVQMVLLSIELSIEAY
uniref:Uncharacterized protein n=1 Tax=Cacopsylla melanoneura TaxID=428564 RepID=A0A8D8RGS1_9HEMI